MQVWVFYAPEQGEPLLRRVTLPAGATVGRAIDASGLRADRPEIDAPDLRYAIAGRRVTAAQVLADGDRVDLCRPLHVDPMTARRLRAAAVRQAASRAKPGR